MEWSTVVFVPQCFQELPLWPAGHQQYPEDQLMMVKLALEAAAQVTLPTWCYFLALNTMFSPSTSRLSP